MKFSKNLWTMQIYFYSSIFYHYNFESYYTKSQFRLNYQYFYNDFYLIIFLTKIYYHSPYNYSKLLNQLHFNHFFLNNRQQTFLHQIFSFQFFFKENIPALLKNIHQEYYLSIYYLYQYQQDVNNLHNHSLDHFIQILLFHFQ